MKQLRFILLTVMCMLALGANAQQITSVHGTVSDDMGPLMGATVCEIDGTGRIIERRSRMRKTRSVSATWV